jgi:acyl carrier protein
LTLDAPLEALGIDSLGVAELLFTVEDEFSVRLSPNSVPLATDRRRSSLHRRA